MKQLFLLRICSTDTMIPAKNNLLFALVCLFCTLHWPVQTRHVPFHSQALLEDRPPLFLPRNSEAHTRTVYVLNVLHKGGSSVAADVMMEACQLLGRQIVSLYNFTRLTSVQSIRLKDDKDANEEDDVRRMFDQVTRAISFAVEVDSDVCVGPVRNFEVYATKTDLSSKKVRVKHMVMLRHPFDLLVSGFYSFGWMHANGRNKVAFVEKGLDAWVLENAPSLRARYAKAIPLGMNKVPGHLATVCSYDEMVLAPKNWMRKLTRFLEVSYSVAEVLELMRPFEKLSATAVRALKVKAVTLGHERAVIPGDYRFRLQARTIAELEHMFGEILNFFKSINFEGHITS